MAILDFQRPDKVYMVKSDDYFGVFEFFPLEQGYGITVGNALRRVLLNSLEGFAITSIKIEGVEHEFSTIKGVVEDVTELILNLKQVRFRQQIEGTDEEVLNINLVGKDQFLAKDIGGFTSAFQVLNTDHVICNLDKKVKLNIEMTIKKSRGYVPSEENKPEGEDVQPGMIYIDSIHTPIKHVKYSVENYRVGQKTDYEKLIFEISTDGSIAPVDSLKEAAKILIKYFMLFSDEQITLGDDDKKGIKTFDEDSLHMRQLLKTRLSSLDLSVRALNCLKSSEIDTLGDLVQYSKHDLLKFRNFGKKSLVELEELLVNKKLDFGMDVSEFNLDKE